MLTRRAFLKLGAIASTAGTLPTGCGMNVQAVTQQTSHRPWPLPQTRWVMSMRWHDLLFLHWPVRPQLIRPLIPAEIDLETFDGWCWIGVVPFYMTGVRARYIPLPLAFPELNVRTYVNTPGRSGVWFFSLDAANWLAVRVARWFGLPYYNAQMPVELRADAIHYKSARVHRQARPAEFDASYRPAGAVYQAGTRTLEHWLTERYCLYAAKDGGQIVYGEIHHLPWPLQPAEVELRVNTMTQPIGIDLPGDKPLCHFARYQEVLAWPIVPLRRLN